MFRERALKFSRYGGQIEGKIGQIINQETGERIQLPVRNETIVDLQRTRFDSKMTTVSLCNVPHLCYGFLLTDTAHVVSVCTAAACFVQSTVELARFSVWRIIVYRRAGQLPTP